MLNRPIPLKFPIIQIAIDVPDIDAALKLAEIGVEAGVDWLEAGTPLIVRRGADSIGAIARAFPEYPVLADYKTMDSGGKNVELTLAQGGHIMTVCAGAADDTIKAAVAARKETGVLVVVDTIGVRDQVARAKEVEAMGVDGIYLHYAADQWRKDPSKDSTQWVPSVASQVKCMLGAGVFGIDDAVKAVSNGADLVAIGHPLISGSDPAGKLKEFCQRVREAYRPRIK